MNPVDKEHVIEVAQMFDELDEVGKKSIELQAAAINLYKAMEEKDGQQKTDRGAGSATA